MKKISFVSAFALGITTSLALGVSAAFAATSLTGTAQTNVTTTGVNVGVGVNTNVNGSSTSVTSATVTNMPMMTASSSSSTTENLGPGIYNSGMNGSATASGNASINISSNDPQVTAYAQSVAASDASVSDISSDNNTVSISYLVPVKLFGFIPVRERETASVDTSDSEAAKVSVHRSWWSFLAAGNSGSDAEAFSSALSAQMNSTPASAATQANIMADIEATARTEMSASANANTSASTGY